jgi:hypothetical protein
MRTKVISYGISTAIVAGIVVLFYFFPGVMITIALGGCILSFFIVLTAVLATIIEDYFL